MTQFENDILHWIEGELSLHAKPPAWARDIYDRRQSLGLNFAEMKQYIREYEGESSIR